MRKSKFLNLIHLNGEWLVANPVAKSGNLGALDESHVALLEAGEPELRAQDDATRETLVEYGVLVEEGKESPWDELSAAFSYDVFRFLSLRNVFQYLDYSKEAPLEEDRRQMETYAELEPPPPLKNDYPNAPKIRLTHPAVARRETEETRVAALLFWGFGRLQTRSFHGHPVYQKPVPSNGARHPLNAYLSVGEDSGTFARGLYHYDPETHALDHLNEKPQAVGLYLILTATYEREQWRYRHSWSYKDIHFDVGHTQATLHYAAHYLKMKLTPTTHPPQGEPLIEEPQATYKIEL